MTANLLTGLRVDETLTRTDSTGTVNYLIGGLGSTLADGVTNELTRADITAAVMFQASLPVPTQAMPDTQKAREAVREGPRRFDRIGCTSCHVPALPLDRKGWIFSEPNPERGRR